MNLPFTKHQNLPEKREYFFVLEVGLGAVQVALWSVVNAKPQILAIGNSVIWKNDSVDSLIQSVDQSLGMACERGGITSDNQPQKMILGLPADWVEQDKIIPAKLSWLKVLSEKLDLKPVGFVMEHEAIIRFIQLNEGVPATAILLLVWPDFLEATLVRLGKVVGTVLVRKSQSLTEDVVEGLARLPKVEILPSRIFLTGSGVDMEQARQLLLNYSWTTPSKKFSFLHFPKVEILSSDFGAKAIASSVGTEMGELFEQDTPPEPVVEASSSDFGFSTEDVTTKHVEPEKIWEPESPPKQKINFKFPSFSLKIPNLSMIFIGVLILALVIGGIGALYWFVPKAVISLVVIPKSVSQNIDLTLNTKIGSADISNAILSVKVLEVEVKGDQTVPVTGNKLTGDKATGSVTITNNIDKVRALPSGTSLVSPSGLKFVTDDAVTVASASGFPPNIQYGKATVKVTALLIGSDYNLSAATDFRVGSYTSLETAAKNEAALSGGTSRQVKAVSKEDISGLKSTLTEKLKISAKDKLMAQIGADDELLLESVVISIISEDFDHKQDETADNLKLISTVKARAFTYKKNDLEQVISSKISTLLPEGYVHQQEISKTFFVKQIDKESAKVMVKVKAVMWPDINKPETVKLYIGKDVAQSISSLSGINGVERASIVVNPKLPFLGGRLPFKPDNITLDLVSK